MAGWIKNTPIPPVTWDQVSPDVAFRKLYAPLGEIVVVFADLEESLTDALRVLMGASWRGSLAVEGLMQNVTSRIELFYFLAMQATNPSETDRPNSKAGQQIQDGAAQLRIGANGLYGSLQQANSDRNNLLHGAWHGISPDGESYAKNRFLVRSGEFKPIRLVDVSITLLTAEVAYMISVNLRLTDWTARLRRLHLPHLWPAPLPDKYRLHSPLQALLQAQKPPHAKRSPKEGKRPPPPSPP